jgi:hypothetical protein
MAKRRIVHSIQQLTQTTPTALALGIEIAATKYKKKNNKKKEHLKRHKKKYSLQNDAIGAAGISLSSSNKIGRGAPFIATGLEYCFFQFKILFLE